MHRFLTDFSANKNKPLRFRNGAVLSIHLHICRNTKMPRNNLYNMTKNQLIYLTIFQFFGFPEININYS